MLSIILEETYKIRYNGLNKRFKELTNYLNDPDIPNDKKDEVIDEWQALYDKLNDIVKQHPKMTSDEVINGFKIENTTNINMTNKQHRKELVVNE